MPLRRPRREGVITLTFGLVYGCARILEDSLRIDKRFGPFTGSQWTALSVALLSAGILIWWALHPSSEPAEPADVAPDGSRQGVEASPDDG